MFFKRIFSNKIYWLSVLAAVLLLMCSVVYVDYMSGTEYMLISLLYDDVAQEALSSGMVSMVNIILGYDNSYMWMFCPIIVGMPCIITNRTERFVLVRTSKNNYILSKYLTNIFSGGCILVLAYILFIAISLIITKENIGNEYIIRKLLSVYCWGMLSALPSIILSEFVHNKYLILCIPFVINYFMIFFVGNILPYDIAKYVTPTTYQIIFLDDKETMIYGSCILIILIVMCAFLKKIVLERRCDCGQR